LSPKLLPLLLLLSPLPFKVVKLLLSGVSW
jgi:hypothetical protein